MAPKRISAKSAKGAPKGPAAPQGKKSIKADTKSGIISNNQKLSTGSSGKNINALEDPTNGSVSKKQGEKERFSNSRGSNKKKNDSQEDSGKVRHSEIYNRFDTMLTLLSNLDTYITDLLSDDENKKGKMVEENMNEAIASLRIDMRRLIDYCEESRKKLENIRLPIHKITSNMASKIVVQPVEELENAEVCQADLKKKLLMQQLAKINDELLQASKITTETEVAALESEKVCLQTIELAEQIKKQIEEKNREAARLAEEEEEEEEEELMEDLQKEVMTPEQLAIKQEESYDWPTFPLHITSRFDFDGGVACLVKADPALLYDGEIQAEPIETMDIKYNFNPDEELVSGPFRIFIPESRYNDGARLFRPGMCISIPQVMPRIQFNTKELAMKVQVANDNWITLKTTEKLFDSYKDLKFAQANTNYLGNYIVVSRNKQETIRVKRMGGIGNSKLDDKLSIQVPSDALIKPEKVTIQIRTIDSTSIKNLKKVLPLANNLMTASSIFKLQWANFIFQTPIKMTIPIPTNPVVLKKMNTRKNPKEEEANLKQAKPKVGSMAQLKMSLHKLEAKKSGKKEEKEENKKIDEKLTKAETKGVQKKNEKEKITEDKEDQEEKDDLEEVKDEEEGVTQGALSKPLDWYMGIYDVDTEDESDALFLVIKKDNQWVVEDTKIERTDLDVVTITLKEPPKMFIVLRTSLKLKIKDAGKIAKTLDEILGEKIVCFIISQNITNPYDFITSVLPLYKMEKFVAMMTEKNFNLVYKKEHNFMVKEGEKMYISFRGNFKCSADPPKLMARFNHNFDCHIHFQLREYDIFVQKCYDVYRGFVQLNRIKNINKGSDDKLEIDSEMITELLVTLPKDQELLKLKVIESETFMYDDENCELTNRILIKLADELGQEWIDLATNLGLSPVVIHLIRNNAESNNMLKVKNKLVMLQSWNKVQKRSSSKIEILFQALNKIHRQDLVSSFERAFVDTSSVTNKIDEMEGISEGGAE